MVSAFGNLIRFANNRKPFCFSCTVTFEDTYIISSLFYNSQSFQLAK